MNPPRKDADLGDGTTISVSLFRWIIGGLVSIFLVLIGAIWWAAVLQANVGEAVRNQGKQTDDIAAIRKAMDDLSSKVSVMQGGLEDQWKLSDTIWWTAEFHRLNPTLSLPALGDMPSLMRGRSRDR